MKIIAFNGLTIDDLSYSAWLENPFSQPARQVETMERAGRSPLVTQTRLTARTLTVGFRVWGESANDEAALVRNLLAKLDTGDQAVELRVADEDDENERSIYVVVRSVDEQPDGEGTGWHLVATCVAHEEAYWRKGATTEVWQVTASPDEQTVLNGGDQSVGLKLTITPNAQKSTAGFEHARFAAVRWLSSQAVTNYPIKLKSFSEDVGAPDPFFVDFVDVADLISESEISSAANVTVFVNGKEARRWHAYSGEYFTGTWVNLSFAPGATAILGEGISGNGSISTIKASTDISGFPARGLLSIGTELFDYSSRDTATRTFRGVRRAARNTAETAASAGATIYWIQNEVWVMWGTGTAATEFNDYTPPLPAENVNNDFNGYDVFKPMIQMELSENRAWRWRDFGGSLTQHAKRPLSWYSAGAGATAENDASYDGQYGTVWRKLKLRNNLYETGGNNFWIVPIAHSVESFRVQGRGRQLSWGNEGRYQVMLGVGPEFNYTFGDLPVPIGSRGLGPWYDFDYQRSNLGNTGITGMFWAQEASSAAAETELTYVIVTFYNAPSVVIAPEIELYNLDMTISNTTTGEAIDVKLPMEMGDALEIDSERHTVKLLSDDSNQYQAVTRNGARQKMLTLAKGSNVLRATEAGVTNVTIAVAYEEVVY